MRELSLFGKEADCLGASDDPDLYEDDTGLPILPNSKDLVPIEDQFKDREEFGKMQSPVLQTSSAICKIDEDIVKQLENEKSANHFILFGYCSLK